MIGLILQAIQSGLSSFSIQDTLGYSSHQQKRLGMCVCVCVCVCVKVGEQTTQPRGLSISPHTEKHTQRN